MYTYTHEPYIFRGLIMTSRNLVLRSMYIEPEIDDMLRNEAFNSRTSKNDLLRKYLSLGIQAAKDAASPAVAPKKPAAKRSAPVNPIKHVDAGKENSGMPAVRKTSVTAAAGRKTAPKRAA
jgi:hypothetical protein